LEITAVVDITQVWVTILEKAIIVVAYYYFYYYVVAMVSEMITVAGIQFFYLSF
jgi:hypothetical protein